MNKPELRKQLKTQRQKLSDVEVKEFSRQIINKCRQMIDWTQILSIHSYLPLTKNNEVDTLPLLRAARQVNPKLKIASSDLSGQTYWLDSDFQPTKKVPENFQYGLIIVPMLAFDKYGHRLGYGGGFYDKFLASQLQALTIGLGYEMGHLDKLPAEPYDIVLKAVVTPSAVYKF